MLWLIQNVLEPRITFGPSLAKPATMWDHSVLHISVRFQPIRRLHLSWSPRMEQQNIDIVQHHGVGYFHMNVKYQNDGRALSLSVNHQFLFFFLTNSARGSSGSWKRNWKSWSERKSHWRCRWKRHKLAGRSRWAGVGCSDHYLPVAGPLSRAHMHSCPFCLTRTCVGWPCAAAEGSRRKDGPEEETGCWVGTVQSMWPGETQWNTYVWRRIASIPVDPTGVLQSIRFLIPVHSLPMYCIPYTTQSTVDFVTKRLTRIIKWCYFSRPRDCSCSRRC